MCQVSSRNSWHPWLFSQDVNQHSAEIELVVADGDYLQFTPQLLPAVIPG